MKGSPGCTGPARRMSFFVQTPLNWNVIGEASTGLPAQLSTNRTLKLTSAHVLRRRTRGRTDGGGLNSPSRFTELAARRTTTGSVPLSSVIILTPGITGDVDDIDHPVESSDRIYASREEARLSP